MPIFAYMLSKYGEITYNYKNTWKLIPKIVYGENEAMYEEWT